MKTTELNAILPKFVQQISQDFIGHSRPLRVSDLRLAIRNARMTEISPWSNHDLDLIEVHAAQFDATDPLGCVLDPPANGYRTLDVASVSSICAPSPFAWV